MGNSTYNVFGILNASSDLSLLEDSFNLVKGIREQELTTAKDIRDTLLNEWPSMSPNDCQAWSQFAGDEFNDRVYHRLPRIVYNPFLVSMYTVYESAVAEIASIVQERRGLEDSLSGREGNFLDQAKHYHRDQLGLKLSASNESWERLKILAGIRHAIAHANGYLDGVNASMRVKLREWMKQNIGIEDYYGEVVVSWSFVRTTFEIVRDDLGDLIVRFKVADRSSSD